MMFRPKFVFDSRSPSVAVNAAIAANFLMVDVREAGASVHHGNPAVVVYDQGVIHTIDGIKDGRDRFFPPKNTGVMTISDVQKGKGHVRALPDRVEFVEWFWDAKVQYFNRLTGNFRVGPPNNKPVATGRTS